MLSRVSSILQMDCLLDLSRPVLVGVSGGADSLCLLDLLWRLNVPVIAAHYNHQLYPGSDSAASKVASLSNKMGVTSIQGVGDVKNFAEEGGFTLEEAARILRYQFLFREGKLHNVQAVAVGHNANDQVETFLIHLLRGSGMRGLTGMRFHLLPSPWSEDIPLVRPLLNIWREEILHYLTERNLTPIVDPTNQDVAFVRNRIRHQLIPSLEKYNPRVRHQILNTINVLQEDYAVLKGVILDAWQDCFIEQGAGYVALDRHRLLSAPTGIQRYVFRRAMASLSGDMRDIDFELTDRAIKMLSKPPKSGLCELTSTISLLIEENHLWVFSIEAALPDKKWPQLWRNTELSLEVPGKLHLDGDWILETERVPYNDTLQDQVFSNNNLFRAYLDAAKVQTQMLVRKRKPGDRIKPLGMEGRSMKLAHFMVNEKIPKRARERWPLICNREEILWVPGYRSSHYARVSEETKEIICLHLKCKDCF